MISEGRVTVDGAIATIGQKIDPEVAQVEIDGVPLPLKPDLIYYLMYKEKGVISTADDPQGRPTVVDQVPPEPRVFPVGRLDADSEGLLLLTNDGDLTNRLSHPSFGVTKTYLAKVSGEPDTKALEALVAQGVELEDGLAKPVSATLIDSIGDVALVELVMGEGRNREVRRIFDAIGHPVNELVRTAIGPLRDQRVQPGT
ncbi:MAG: rRNA pseudouridine synthase, partial [Acidimicrobiia bacterium]|nr:rRNA pseudouridine synthase [Acidimicrobiia bacterium]